jgi:hypothetical protein
MGLMREYSVELMLRDAKAIQNLKETNLIQETFIGETIILSACAEDCGLCPRMNAQNVVEYFTHRRVAASADFAVGG